MNERTDSLKTHVGVFSPARTDTLRPGVEALIGQTLEFRYCWTNDDDESNYPGEKCYEVENREQYGLEFIGWVPECDIEWSPDA
jgi:hypothetical protein